MKRLPTFFIALLSATPYVVGHGFVMELTIEGKTYEGNFPSGPTADSGIRQISDPSPVKGAKNLAVNCGTEAQKASQILDANPGDDLTFNWRGADSSKWPHNTGPMLTYMASCQDTPCNEFESQNAKWFKIQQVGKKQGGGDWQQQDLMDGGVAPVTLPSNIAPGQYLVRHEIIALHLADQKGGAEFYPSCAQLRIGGNGTASPSANELVSLPGAYDDNDPGIFVPNVYDAGLNYQFPGPPISQLAASSSGTPSSSTSSKSGTKSGSPTSSSSPPKPTKGTKVNTSGLCHLKKQPKSPNLPRHLYRIMRALTGRSH